MSQARRSSHRAPDARLWVIYDHPRDYPEHFVMRRWLVSVEPTPEPVAGLYDSLAEARADIPPHSVNLGRKSEDDPVLVEAWL